MAKKEIKVKGIDGRKEATFIIQDLVDLVNEPKGDEVQAYQEELTSSKTIIIDSETQRLTITIAE
jgi:hypothetical protein